MSRWRHHWTCPACSHEHHWSWPLEDKPDRAEPCWQHCERCGRWSEMIWQAQAGGWVWTGKIRKNAEGPGWYGQEGEGSSAPAVGRA